MPKPQNPRRRGAEPVPAAKLDAFFASLAEHASVTAATNTADMQRFTLYQLRRADSAFAARWDEAKAMGVDPGGGRDHAARPGRRAQAGVLRGS